MKIIHRYVGFALFRQFALLLVAVVAIYVAVDFFEKIDDFMEARASLGSALLFFAYRVPAVLTQVMPVGVLLSALVVFGVMGRHNEIVAFRCCGGPARALALPAVVLGMVSGIAVFILSEAVVPYSAEKADEIWLGQVKKKSPRAGRENDIWFTAKGAVGHIGHVDRRAGLAAYDLTLTYLTPDFRLARRVDARKAVYEKGVWRLSDVTDQNFAAGGLHVTYPKTQSVELSFSPEDLGRAVKKPDEMTYRQLSAYARRVAAEGYDDDALRSDLAAKISFPFVSLIMGVLGGCLSLRRTRGDGLAANVLMGMGLAFSFWVVHSVSLSLGYAGRSPPLVAAWAADFLFGLLAAWLYTRLA
ncbi:MAG: LPS export ABC transporter permease LptG [Thermodesulfobacteriota bacterium]